MASKKQEPREFAAVIIDATQLGQAVKLLAHLQTKRIAAHAVRDQAKIDADAAAVEALQVTVGDRTIDGEEYEQAWIDAVEQFCRSNRKLFNVPFRELRFPHGAVRLRKNPHRVEVIGSQAIQVAKVAESIGTSVGRFLKRIKLWPFWTFKVVPDFSAIKEQAAAGKLSDADLKKRGFRYLRGADRVEIDFDTDEAGDDEGK